MLMVRGTNASSGVRLSRFNEHAPEDRRTTPSEVTLSAEMSPEVQPKVEEEAEQHDFLTQDTANNGLTIASDASKPSKAKSHGLDKDSPGGAKRRCVSTACIACRKRKSKCDGNTPSCAACSSVYNTECIYDPNSDHRRKGVYKKDIDNLKTRNSTLQTLIQAILNYPENEVLDLVKQIRTCESLDDVAESIITQSTALDDDDEADEGNFQDYGAPSGVPQFEKELSGKMGKLRLDNGSVSIIGGTSNLIFLGSVQDGDDDAYLRDELEENATNREPITSWTEVTSDPRLISHLMNMYFTWHYTFFTTLSKSLFWRDFKQGKPARDAKYKTEYCTPLLVNAMLALGCHFTSWPAARADPEDSATAGDHFSKEAKRLILENDEHEKPKIATVQALALMSVREAGCGREARGWVYSGMSFRMAYDLGLNIGSGAEGLQESEVDARRITIWGCFLFDKCWSNYLGRQPQLPLSSISVPKIDVFPNEDADIWRPHTDSGTGQAHAQHSRTRAVALQISQLCEISSDLILYFYHPHRLEKPLGKQAELKKLSELHTRLEAWKKDLPKEFEPKEGQLPNILVMHMFFQLLYIHLFRPFLKYKPASSPLPAHVSPRKFLIQAATAVSKLMRLYRRTYGLRQICNIVVYITHSACTVHLFNLPDKFANRDIVHGLNHLEEISESWLCARRTLGILFQVSKRWKIELPKPALKTLERAEAKFGILKGYDQGLSPKPNSTMQPPPTPTHPLPLPESNTMPPTQYSPPAISSSSCLSSAAPIVSPVLTPYSPQQRALINTSPQTADLNAQPGQAHFIMPQVQQGFWNSDQTAHPRVSSSETTLPAMMFGGVESLMKDQEWWMQDSNQIFANWNGYESHENYQMTGTGHPNNTQVNVGEGMSNGMNNGMDNGMGNGMCNSMTNGLGNGLYPNDTYEYLDMSNGHMDDGMSRQI